MHAFKPAWWLRSPHLQTMWPTLFRRDMKKFVLRRERLELPDGDFIDLDWSGGKQGPIVLVLHGLEGSIDSPYAKGMLAALNEQGWRSVFMHFRGCSGEMNRLPRMYHSGETHDLDFVVKTLQKNYPNTPLAAIGFSLGGNVLLKWLGETQQQNPLTAAVAVSVPFELWKTSNRIQKGFSRFYQWYFLKKLLAKVAQKPAFQAHSLPRMRTIRDFDHYVTAPLHGFLDVDDYYARASSRPYLKSIQVPTLVLHAKDDPFMTPDTIPEQQELSEYVKLEITEEGGHVGFVCGRLPWRPVYWIEQRAPLFLQAYLQSRGQGVSIGNLS